MLKFKYLPLLFVIVSVNLTAQSLQLSNQNGQLSFGDTIHVFTANDEFVKTDVFITNTTNFPIDVKIKKDVLQILPAAFNTFCWGQCFAPDVTLSPIAITIESLATNSNGFYSDYSALGENGISIIRFVFFDANNVNDSNHVFIKYYSTPTSVLETKKLVSEISNPFPNPATNYASFNYNLALDANDAKIVILNVAGVVVQEVALPPLSNKININLSNHTSGLYFYSFVVNGKTISTRKLIIQR